MTGKNEQIIKTEYTEEMSSSYIDYAMSVITARAVPDARDGFKPVHRKILYAMNQLRNNYDKPYRKCAKIVGSVLGAYSPHGDSSTYDALVVMSQNFKKRVPFVDGHGNFGSIEGDGAAAYRYTECRLEKFTEDVFLNNLDKDIVEYMPNFDNTEIEPTVLPAKLPNLLLNGTDGIAVGMVSSIPTHNLSELIQAEIYLLNHPDATVEELMQFVQGPDWPTGGIVINKKELLEIYEKGSGKIKVRGKVIFEPREKRNEKDKLVITEIPATMVGSALSKFFTDLDGLMRDKQLPEVTDIMNSSGKDGIRIVLELKNGADIERIKNILYTKTKLEDTFGVNMLAIVNGRPKVLSLKEILEEHIKFSFDINTKKYEKLLAKTLERQEIVDGLMKAYDLIDLIIAVLRGSKSIKDAKECLMTGNADSLKLTKKQKDEAKIFNFTQRQAEAILEMKLQRLIGLEILALENEAKELVKKIKKYEKLLKSKAAMSKEIEKELLELDVEYGDARRTEIIDGKKAEKVKKVEVEQDLIFVINRFGYCKTIDAALFAKWESNIMEDQILSVPCKSTHKMFVFTDQGMVYQMKISDIPLGKTKDKGIPIENFIKFKDENEERILFIDEGALKERQAIFVTKNGYVKSVSTDELISSKKVALATKLSEDDKVICIQVDPKKDFNVVTNKKVNKKIKLSEVKLFKKTAMGNKLIKLKKGDYLIGVEEKKEA